MAEAIEMGDLDRDNNADGDEAAADADEAETNLDDDNRLNVSIPIFDGSNPDAGAGSSRPDTSTIPNPRQDARVIRMSYTLDKKDFFKREFGISLNKSDSKTLFDEMELTMNKDLTKINGAKYKDVKVIVLKNGKMEFSVNKTHESTINEFKELIEEAKREHSQTTSGLVEEELKTQNLDAPIELVDAVRTNSLERIDSAISDRVDDISNDVLITENELRELRGILVVKGRTSEEKIRYLEITENHWKELAETEKTAGRKEKALLYEAIAGVAELKADEVRLRSNQRPKGERALSIVEEEINVNDLTRFERFKKWAKENLGGISVVAISVSGIITTIVMGARNAIKTGARATSNFAKAMAGVAKKVGPVVGALLNIVAKILTLGAKGVEFLSRNLWILAIALTYFLYNEIKNKKKR